MSEGIKNLGFKEILDKSAKSAVLAKIGGASASQISNLLSVLEAERGEDAVYLLIAYIARQTKRGEISEAFARDIIGNLQQFLSLKKSSETIVETVRQYLGLIKWIFDSMRDIRDRRQIRHVNNFEEFINEVFLPNLRSR
ncbi:MAG: hypothetical protein ACTSSP_04385 [Candidatus Asgardarchaeia archaeon]